VADAARVGRVWLLLLWLLLLRGFCGPPLPLLLAAGVGGTVVHAAAAPAASLFRALPLAAMCALRTEGRGMKGGGQSGQEGTATQQLARVSAYSPEETLGHKNHASQQSKIQ
jgi:hypothetical protein